MPFKVRVWGILGAGQTGKSAIIGHLISQLGRGGGGFRLVPLRGGGYLQVYARRQSLQEARARRTPEQVVKEFTTRGRHRGVAGWFNLLIAIRTDVVGNLPRADVYLRHFVQTGWAIESLVILDYEERRHSRYYDFGAPICELHDASDMARTVRSIIG